MERINDFLLKIVEIFDPLICLMSLLYLLISQIVILCIFNNKAMILQSCFIFFEIILLYLVLIDAHDKTFEKYFYISPDKKCFYSSLLCNLKDVLRKRDIFKRLKFLIYIYIIFVSILVTLLQTDLFKPCGEPLYMERDDLSET